MKRTIVFYYSKMGSNHYLAQKIAEKLDCPIEAIKPWINIRLLFLMGLNPGNRKLRSNPAEYDRVILCGPIWMGKLVPPLKNVLNHYKKEIKELVFVTCCGSGFEMKDEKFGHAHVFAHVRTIYGKEAHCEAFPITLVLSEKQIEDGTAIMNTRLSDANFNGEIQTIFDKFITKLSTS